MSSALYIASYFQRQKAFYIQKLHVLCLFGLTLLPLAWHQTSADPIEERMTITASRVPTDQMRTGNGIAIITREQILRQNPASLGDILRGLPGVSVSQQSGRGGLTQVRLRGREANHVLVLVDGIEANDISQGSEFNFSQFPVHHIDRIEVVYGAESALWGSDAVAGVIHIMTRSPYAEPSTDLSVSQGGQGSQHINLSSSSNLGPLRWAGGVSFWETEGFNVSRQGDERDGADQKALFLRGTSALTENWQWSAAIRAQKNRNDFDDVDYYATGLPIDANFETDHQQWLGGLTLESVDQPIAQKLTVNYNRDKNINQTYPGSQTLADGEKRQVNYQISRQQRGRTFIGFIEHERNQFTQAGLATIYGDPNQSRTVSQLALGGEYRLDTPDWTAALSLRLEDNSDFGQGYSARGSAAYFLSDQTKLRAALGRSVKNPTFTERFGYFTNFVGNPDLIPEVSLELDIGIQHQFSKAPITVNLSAYTARLDDEINGFVFDATTFLYTAQNEATVSKQHGFDLNLDWQIHSSVALKAYYGRLTAKDGLAQIELRRPRHKAGMAINFDSDRWSTRLAADYTGSLLDNFFPPTPPYSEIVELDQHTLVSLSSRFTVNEKLDLQLNVDNVFDKHFESVYGYRQSGRLTRIGLNFRFN